MNRMKISANKECSSHGVWMDLNGKSKKALPPDRVEPKWPTPTTLRR